MTNTDTYGRLYEAIQTLTARCDGAQSLDGQGFNKLDTDFGKSLARQLEWTPRQAAAAWRMLRTYKAQLAACGLDLDDIPQPDSGDAAQLPDATKPAERRVVVLDAARKVVGFVFPYTPDLLPALRGWATWQKPVDRKAWQVTVTDSDKAAKILVFAEDNDFVVPDSVRMLCDAATAQAAKNREASTAAVASGDFHVDGLGGTLYPFQLAGVQYVVEHGGIGLIADEMGLGKSVQSLAVVQKMNAFPVLIVCPATLKVVWQRFVQTWLPGKLVTVVNGKDVAGGADCVVANFDICWRADRYDALLAYGFKAIIIDECHLVKDAKSLRSRAMLHSRQVNGKWISEGLAVGPKVKVLLSGTPLLNRVSELVHPLAILGKIKDFGGSWRFLQDYCLPGDAPILTSDLTEKPINQIQIGDRVIGWERGNIQRRLCHATVINILVRQAALQRVDLLNGDFVVCTPDHRWLSGRGEIGIERIEYQSARQGRATGAGLGCASQMVQIVPSLQGFIPDRDYKIGYVVGFMHGDGCCRLKITHTYHPMRNKEKISKGEVAWNCGCKDIECISRVAEYLDELGIAYTKTLRATMKLVYLIGIGNKQAMYDLLSCPPLDTDSWWAGFLGGIYDAEGNGQSIAQYLDINPKTYTMIVAALDRFSLPYKKHQKHVNMCGGRKTMVRFWKIAQPALRRKLCSYMMNGGGKFMGDRTRVAKIIPIDGIHTVYTLTTTTGNYVAYGYGSKNCNAEHNGFGWTFNGVKDAERLNRLLREKCMIRRTKEQVLKELPAKTYAVIPVELSNRKEYERAEEDTIAFIGKRAAADKEFLAKIAHLPRSEQIQLRADRAADAEERAARAETLTRIGALRELTGLGKIEVVKEWVTDFLESGEKLVVFAHHRAVQHEIAKAFPGCATITGDQDGEDRQANVDRFQNDDGCRLIVCSLKAGGLGITLTAASNVALVELDWSAAALIQAGDRVHRIGQDKPVTIWQIVGQDTMDEYMAAMTTDKQHGIDAVIDGKAETDDQVGFGGLIAWLQRKGAV